MGFLTLEVYLVVIIGIYFLLDKSGDEDAPLVKWVLYCHMVVGTLLSYY
jgi:hypothetical protein